MTSESLDYVMQEVTARIDFFERTYKLSNTLVTESDYDEEANWLRVYAEQSHSERPLDRYLLFLVMRRAFAVQYKPDDDEPRLPSECWWFLSSHLNCEEAMPTAALNRVNAELKALYLSWPLEDRRLVLRFIRAARRLPVVERWLARGWTRAAITWEALAQ